MHRPFYYPSELPMVEDFLDASKFAYVGLGALIQSAIGRNVGIAAGDFAISATGPASLSVNIGTGAIYAMETIDPNAYSTLGTDANQIMKQGILIAPTTVTITPPTTSGFEQYYLVEIGFNETDANAIVPPYFNTLNPAVPLNGAGGTGAAQPTVRQNLAVVTLKAGAAAAVGSAVVPTPDVSFSPMWVIHVINGQTSITSANWFPYTGAPTFPSLESLYSIFQQIIAVNTTYFVNNAIGSDTTGNGSSQFPWASIGHAIAVIATFNLGGNTVTIQLGLTGVAYVNTGLVGVSPPSNGTLVIHGDAAAQGSYTIQGASIVSSAVVSVNGTGQISIVGLTIVNTASVAGSCLIANNGASVSLTNVTFHTTTIGTLALVAAGVAGQATIGAGCIMGGASQNMILIQSGGSVVQSANVATSGTPAFTTAVINNQSGYYALTTTGLSWTGTGCTGTRYSVVLNGVVNTGGGGASFFPGSAVGTTATGGQYV